MDPIQHPLIPDPEPSPNRMTEPERALAAELGRRQGRAMAPFEARYLAALSRAQEAEAAVSELTERNTALREALLSIVDGVEDDPDESDNWACAEFSYGDLRQALGALAAPSPDAEGRGGR